MPGVSGRAVVPDLPSLDSEALMGSKEERQDCSEDDGLNH